ncbi:sorting nexin-8 isoform X1 [Hydra vulgaris]|uniref:Sorting nexin-8 n=1 Tax=Hydra vulgaris TaxID=6087 RepID=T2M309_HYDVU|nr:sorting nexin-8 [Hydra vulgaris]
MEVDLDQDSIEIELQAEKKGLLLKYREYVVFSKRHKMSVQRRYNDFSSFYDVLLMRYPYRIIPKLPPKKIGANKEFIEGRRRALKRFLTIIMKHPAMREDNIISYFLSYTGSDVGSKLKEQFKGVPDEFITNPLSSKAKDMVPSDTQGNLANSRQQIFTIHRCLMQVKDVIDRLANRTDGNSQDMVTFSKNMLVLSEESSAITNWATGGKNTWQLLQKGFKSLVEPFTALSEKYAIYSTKETQDVGDCLEMFLDITTGYKDLLERHEKGVLRDHQLALNKMQQYKQKHHIATVKNVDSIDQLEQRIYQQEDAIHTMENRNYFSLYCLQMETQLIHSNLNMLIEMLRNLVDVEIKKHIELAALWEEIRVPVDNIASSTIRVQTPVSPSAPPAYFE